MSWEQHRYAVERARDMRRKAADAINDHCMVCHRIDVAGKSDCHCPDGPTYAGVTLQGEANSSDAEMLEEVAEFLAALDRRGGMKGIFSSGFGVAWSMGGDGDYDANEKLAWEEYCKTPAKPANL